MRMFLLKIQWNKNMDKEIKRLSIIGAGELGLQVMHYAELTGTYKVVSFIDDNYIGNMINSVPVLGGINDITHLYTEGNFDEIFIALGYTLLEKRKKVYENLKEQLIPIATIISPNVYIDSTSSIGEGCFLFPGVIVDKNVRINPNVILNLGCVVAHDSNLMSHSFFAPSVTIAGFSNIGQKCFIGCNSTIIDNIRICDDIIIGAGSLVVKHITEPGLYYGVPVKKI